MDEHLLNEHVEGDVSPNLRPNQQPHRLHKPYMDEIFESSDTTETIDDEEIENRHNPKLQTFHSLNLPKLHHKLTANLQESTDQLIMRKDNYLYFLTPKREPCDEGSRQLSEQKGLLTVKTLQPGLASVTKVGTKHHIALVIKDESDSPITDIINKLNRSFRRTIKQLGMHSISIAYTANIRGTLFGES